MNDAVKNLREQYRQAMFDYVVASGGEAALERAYDCGRRAIMLRLGILDLMKIHHAALFSLALDPLLREKADLLTTSGEEFLTQALVPFEIVSRGVSEINVKLHELNEMLEREVAKRTEELRAKNEEMMAMSQQLGQAAKLATMGELIASIAHEMNNPLAIVTLHVESLLVEAPEGDFFRQGLKVIANETDRMARLVATLLQSSRRSQQQISSVDVCEEVRNTLELIHYHLRNRRIAVVQAFAPDTPMIQADRQQLRQVFLNLFTNASDAMPEGGTLTIKVHPDEPEKREKSEWESGRVGEEKSEWESGRVGEQKKEEWESGRVGGKPVSHSPIPPLGGRQGGVEVEVADTGVGIPAENLARVMEPFFTTKPEGRGTGLGLAICRRIVQEHGGTFGIESQAGVGTAVRIALPVSNSAYARELEG